MFFFFFFSFYFLIPSPNLTWQVREASSGQVVRYLGCNDPECIVRHEARILDMVLHRTRSDTLATFSEKQYATRWEWCIFYILLLLFCFINPFSLCLFTCAFSFREETRSLTSRIMVWNTCTGAMVSEPTRACPVSGPIIDMCFANGAYSDVLVVGSEASNNKGEVCKD
jgi:hypothetical protein